MKKSHRGVSGPVLVLGEVAALDAAAGTAGGDFEVIAEVVAGGICARRGVLNFPKFAENLRIEVLQLILQIPQLALQRGVVQAIVLAPVFQPRGLRLRDGGARGGARSLSS